MTFFKKHILLSPKKFKNRNSYLFDGVNERININAVRTALATTTTGTWSCWVKPVDATPVAENEIITFGAGDSTDLIQQYITTTGLLRTSLTNNGAQWDLDTDNAVFSDNIWAHIGLVQDGISPVLYVNGTAPAQTFITTTDKTQWFNNLVTNNGRIGCRFWSAAEGDGGFSFNGNIDEVSIWNVDLTAQQISEIYNNGKPKNLLKHSAVSNLVSYFRMGDNDTWDGTNWTLIDKKGTNNGTSVNMEFSDNELDVI